MDYQTVWLECEATSCKHPMSAMTLVKGRWSAVMYSTMQIQLDRINRGLRKEWLNARIRQQRNKRAYNVKRDSECASCGYVPWELCELTIDHLDGDHQNNTSDNVITLCANCHNRKTQEYQDMIMRPVSRLNAVQLRLEL